MRRKEYAKEGVYEEGRDFMKEGLYEGRTTGITVTTALFTPCPPTAGHHQGHRHHQSLLTNISIITASTDLSVNPLHFGYLNTLTSVHSVGMYPRPLRTPHLLLPLPPLCHEEEGWVGRGKGGGGGGERERETSSVLTITTSYHHLV
jgi:hypothetical protein